MNLEGRELGSLRRDGGSLWVANYLVTNEQAVIRPGLYEAYQFRMGLVLFPSGETVMMGTWGATWLVCLLFLFIGVIGIGLGCIASLLCGRHLAIRVAVVDGATAIAVAFIYAAIIYKIQSARDNWPDISEQTIMVGAGSVILKHALIAAFRSRHQA